MSEKVLFVDDDINVLSALKRQLRNRFNVSTALGGTKALQLIREEGPFAVIVSDMQMPEMNGVELLRNARKIAPDTVRIMLTGNADQQTAVEAVNEGSVFSFLTKPCPQEVMVSAIMEAVSQYHLVKAERELLEGTLNGSVKLMLDMLSMVAPNTFGRTMAIAEMAEKLAHAMRLKDTWNLKLAAMLSNLASITLPPETLAKYGSVALTPEEQQMVTRLPEVGNKLISNIPRLERVAEIVLYHQKLYNGGGFPKDGPSGDNIPLESRILKILCDLEVLKATGMKQPDALERMTGQEGRYDPVILKTATALLGKTETEEIAGVPIETTLSGLVPGHVLVYGIETTDGKQLFAAGNKITEPILERLTNFSQITGIKEPIVVLIEE